MSKFVTHTSGIVVVFLMLASCGTQPKHINVRADQISSLEIKGGPIGASVFIDAANVWKLQGRGKDKISLIDGEHAVRIENNGTEVYQRIVIVKNGTRRVINLR
jgi:hypothetical protein